MDYEEFARAFIDPRHAINIHRESHPEPTTTRAVWLRNNKRLIREMGVEMWLDRLLDVLETGASKTPGEVVETFEVYAPSISTETTEGLIDTRASVGTRNLSHTRLS